MTDRKVEAAATRVYEAVRGAILQGRYPPGSRLKEHDLAVELGVSRTPVREAIRQLRLEGLVDLELHRGAMVRIPGEQDVQEIFDLRAVLEGYCVARAAERADADGAALLAGLVREQRRIADETTGDVRIGALVRENTRFHRALVDVAGSARVGALIRGLTEVPIVYKSRFWDSAREREAGLVFHSEIVEAIAAHDPVRAEAAMRAHIYASKHYFLSEFIGSRLRSGG